MQAVYTGSTRTGTASRVSLPARVTGGAYQSYPTQGTLHIQYS